MPVGRLTAFAINDKGLGRSIRMSHHSE